jgi:hypothetical protein
MAEEDRAVRLAGSTIGCRCHVCAFFDSPDEEYRILLPFVKEGFETGDKTFLILDKEQRTERLHRLAAIGIDPEAAEQRGQPEVRGWENAHLRPGRFDQHAMIGLLEDVFRSDEQKGFGLTRLWANMEWALQDFPGVHDILEYESRVNYVLPKYDTVTVCTYDVTKFSASLLMDVLRTHPYAIVGGILQENSFYVPPDQFLQELHDRRASAH